MKLIDLRNIDIHGQTSCKRGGDAAIAYCRSGIRESQPKPPSRHLRNLREQPGRLFTRLRDASEFDQRSNTILAAAPEIRRLGKAIVGDSNRLV